MMRRTRLLPILLALLATGGFARGEEPATDSGWEAAAKKAQQATVTVRIWTQVRTEADEALPTERQPIVGTPTVPPPPERQSLPAVTVCSGVCVREGRIITAAMAGSDTRIRLTLPGGNQADAKVQVIDEYTGLALLKADTRALVPLVSAEKAPAVGGNVLTAAAWGVEQPEAIRRSCNAICGRWKRRAVRPSSIAKGNSWESSLPPKMPKPAAAGRMRCRRRTSSAFSARRMNKKAMA